MRERIVKLEDFEVVKEQLNEQEVRIMLDQDDFETLCSGGIVTKGDVKIALKDIGYDIMLGIISGFKSKLK